MNKFKSVGEIMTKAVFAVRENESLAEVADLMVEHNCRHVPVINSDREVVGIVSERDLLRVNTSLDLGKLATMDRAGFLSDHPVLEVMSVDPETVDTEASVSEACRILLEYKFDCVPVIEGSVLAGILTTTDILREAIRIESEG